MRKIVNKSLLALAVASVLAAPVAHATNGYFGHGYSTKEKGVAGAGTAYSQDALASATNPAGMVFVGSRLDIGAAIFSPSPRGYTTTGGPAIPGDGSVSVFDGAGVCQTPHPSGNGACAPPFSLTPGSVDSNKDFFLIPHFGYNHMLDENSAVGISIYGNGGMNTQYESGSAVLPNGAKPGLPIETKPGTFGAGTAGVNLEQVFFNISYAKKLKQKHALGVSLIVAAQRFSAQGLENFGQFSVDSTKLAGDKHDVVWGAGIKIGYQGEVSKGFRVGASYQSKISMSSFDEYSGLFAEGGDFDIPPTYNIGISYDITPSSTFIADVQRIEYEDVASISNPVSRLTDGSCNDALNSTIANGGTPTPASGAGCLGGSDGAGFGWQNITIIKLGYQFDVGDNTYRVGYSHSQQPVPNSESLFNIIAPAVIQDHFTAGMTMRLSGNQELNVSGMYAPKESVSGANPFDPSQQVEIEMSQWEVQAGWAWRY